MARRNYISDYRKEIQTIRRRIRRLQARGYEIEIPSFQTPTKSVTKREYERLRNKYSLKNLYKEATYTSESGETIRGTERRKQEAQERGRKAAETRRRNRENPFESDIPQYQWSGEYTSYENKIISNLQNLISTIESWTPEPEWTPNVAEIKRQHKDVLLGKIQRAISNDTNKTRLAEALESNATEIYNIANRLMYATYAPNLVYSKRRDFYSPTEDYLRIDEILFGGIEQMEIEY